MAKELRSIGNPPPEIRRHPVRAQSFSQLFDQGRAHDPVAANRLPGFNESLSGLVIGSVFGGSRQRLGRTKDLMQARGQADRSRVEMHGGPPGPRCAPNLLQRHCQPESAADLNVLRQSDKIVAHDRGLNVRGAIVGPDHPRRDCEIETPLPIDLELSSSQVWQQPHPCGYGDSDECADALDPGGHVAGVHGRRDPQRHGDEREYGVGDQDGMARVIRFHRPTKAQLVVAGEGPA